MSLRYEYFVRITPIFTVGIMGCHGNHEISKTQITFIFEDNIFLHLSGPMDKFMPIIKCLMCSI